MIRAQLDVNEARDTLRSEIHRGVFKTVIDVSLGRISAGLNAAVGLRVSAWPAGLLLGALSLGICGAVAALSGRGEVLLAQLSLHAATLGVGLACLMAARALTHRFLETFSGHILGALARTEDVAECEGALRSIFHVRRQAIFALVATPIIAAPTFHAMSGSWDLAGAPEMLCTALLSGLFAGCALYYAFTALPFLARLGKLPVRLYGMDPANSEVIAALSATSLEVAYIFSAVFATLSLFAARAGLIDHTPQLLALIGMTWVPLLVVSGGAQRTFAQLIQAEKWLVLTDIQDQIEDLQVSERPLKPETLEHLGKLMDFHDRVRATRDSAVDLSAGLGFLNSLALPLLVTVFGNLDAVLAWVRG